jgi:hypothetical protein
MVSGTDDQIFVVDVRNVLLLALNTLASALAMILGKSILLPIDDEVADTSSLTTNTSVYRI